jgi:pimeloyl-ACP methyl ester carboxylesterase
MMNAGESFVSVNDIELFVRRASDLPGRPTIIFLHDSLGCVQLWRDFPDKLCQEVNCNLLIYDRQGYGKSAPLHDHYRTNDYLETEADVLHDLIVTLDLKNVILFGHSDGGSIALIAAGKYPSMFDAVIVEAAHVFVEEVTLNGIRAAVNDYTTTNLNVRLEKYHGDKTDTLFKAWTETWLSQEFRYWNIEHFLPAIECPLLFVQGDRDEYGTIKQITAVVEQVRGEVETYVIPDVYHTPHRESEVTVIESIASFLQSKLSDQFSVAS